MFQWVPRWCKPSKVLGVGTFVSITQQTTEKYVEVPSKLQLNFKKMLNMKWNWTQAMPGKDSEQVGRTSCSYSGVVFRGQRLCCRNPQLCSHPERIQSRRLVALGSSLCFQHSTFPLQADFIGNCISICNKSVDYCTTAVIAFSRNCQHRAKRL